MSAHLVTGFFLALNVAVYLVVRAIYQRVQHPLFNVALIGALAIMGVLLACGFSYEAYVPARDVTTYLLGPATVALAVPLYRNRYLLKAYGLAVFLGVGAGVAVSMATSGLLALAAGLPRGMAVSMTPKGVTIPFAVDMSVLYGGDPAITVFFVICNGILGGSFGTWMLDRFGVSDPVARGLAMGTVSHGIGTAAIFLEGERQGAMSGLAMTLAGVLTAAFAPFLVPLIMR